MTVSREMPVPNYHRHVAPGFGAIKRLARDSASLQDRRRSRIGLKSCFAPHPQDERSFPVLSRHVSAAVLLSARRLSYLRSTMPRRRQSNLVGAFKVRRRRASWAHR